MAKETKKETPKDRKQEERERAHAPPPQGQALARQAAAPPARAARTAVEPVEGFENMEAADLAKPRLALCQSMTPQRKKTDAKYIQGLEEGDFFNTITGERFGPEVTVVPLLFYKSRILFRDIDEGGGMLCQSQDAVTGVGEPGGECASCPMAQFGEKGEAPQCTNFFNYPALVVPAKGPVGPEHLVVLSLKSTGLKAAKDWNSKMRLRMDKQTRRTLPMFRGLYRLSAVEQKNSAGQQWHGVRVENAGEVSAENAAIARDAYESVRDLYRSGRLQVDTAGLQEREPGADDAPAGTGGM
jgi:hypothetical protein